MVEQLPRDDRQVLTHAASLPLPHDVAGVFQTMGRLIMQKVLADHTDRDRAIAAYRQNNEKVRGTIPVDRLLVFNVAEGWEPLCRFLDVPVPLTLFRAQILATNSGHILAVSLRDRTCRMVAQRFASVPPGSIVRPRLS